MVFIFIAMISYLAMLVLGAINPNYSKFSDFEIRRRLNISNKNIDYNDIEILRAECFVYIYYWIKLIYGIVSVSFVSSILFYLHNYIYPLRPLYTVILQPLSCLHLQVYL